MTHDAPTTAERYSTAMNSSHLEYKAERGTDLDVVIAAGGAGVNAGGVGIHSRIGPLLYRLRSEFDQVKGREVQAMDVQRRLQVELSEMKDRFRKEASLGPNSLGAVIEEKQAFADRHAQQEQLFILEQLRTLRETREALGDWARLQATKHRFMESDAVVNVLVGNVLKVFLDGNCTKCNGRGYNGGWSSPKIMCRACRHTGKAKHALGNNLAQVTFCRFLLAEMDRLMGNFEQRMRRKLRQRHL